MVNLVNRVLAARERRSSAELVAAVRELIDQSAEHFLCEERLMAESGYPRADLHTEHHGLMLAQLHRFCERLLAGEDRRTSDRARAFLERWLASHLNEFDRDLAEHLARRVPPAV